MSDKKYTKEHEWIEINDNIGTVGITDNAQEQLGDVVFQYAFSLLFFFTFSIYWLIKYDVNWFATLIYFNYYTTLFFIIYL